MSGSLAAVRVRVTVGVTVASGVTVTVGGSGTGEGVGTAVGLGAYTVMSMTGAVDSGADTVGAETVWGDELAQAVNHSNSEATTALGARDLIIVVECSKLLIIKLGKNQPAARFAGSAEASTPSRLRVCRLLILVFLSEVKLIDQYVVWGGRAGGCEGSEAGQAGLRGIIQAIVEGVVPWRRRTNREFAHLGYR